jgi:hypothetical protein
MYIIVRIRFGINNFKNICQIFLKYSSQKIIFLHGEKLFGTKCRPKPRATVVNEQHIPVGITFLWNDQEWPPTVWKSLSWPWVPSSHPKVKLCKDNYSLCIRGVRGEWGPLDPH